MHDGEGLAAHRERVNTPPIRATDPHKAILEIENFNYATAQVAQTTLRSIVGQVELDELLVNRDEINRQLQQIIGGVKVSLVEIKDVELPDTMRRAMARQAESERERRAKVIHALRHDGRAQRKLRAQPGRTPETDEPAGHLHRSSRWNSRRNTNSPLVAK